ncbi:FadR/GntR family transcriptional regulator [Uliginosibacterium sp. H3]|uniref:FadR/GntR family transcriptional regulator n=1 Tax=Uliginosibacterium silvisoli TaxID=3114758 RepID=A0ABU6JYI4_9RHOO|nr:FadR/GntR family transcriptional regulator [Uliginosibacterium sp. H3]
MTRLSSFAAQTLQRQIHEGQYQPGSSLPGQRELSSALGISRTVLREAVSMLEALGLVHSQPGKGVFVTTGRSSNGELPMGPLDMPPHAVFQFRSIIEPAAAALMARNAGDAEIAALQATQDRMQTALHEMDLVTAADADLEFHLAIAESSANPMLTAAITALEAPIGYSLRLPFANPAEIWEPADEHRVVLDAITRRDPDAAHAAMRTHLVRAAARISIDFETP